MKYFLLLVCFAFVVYTQVNTEVSFVDDTSVNPPNGATLEATSDLNIRDKACTDGRVVITIKTGARVTFTGSVQNGCNYKWYSVRGSFGQGWAASNWLRVVQQGGQTINQRGLDLIKSFEGLRLCKYKDPVGIWTYVKIFNFLEFVMVMY